MNRIASFWFVVVGFSGTGGGLHSTDDALAVVNGDTIRSHIVYLADDRLQGRLPGTPGYEAAVDYVTARYRQYGLEPAGDNGTYLQSVTIRKGLIDESESSLYVVDGQSKTKLEPGTQYGFLPDLNSARSEVTAPLVFVGYGVERQDRSDYAGVDARGKIVIVIAGAPDSLPATEFAHFSNFATKFETAIRHGAAGMVLTTPHGSPRRPRSRRDNSGIVSPSGEAYGRTVFGPSLKFAAFVVWPSMKGLFGMEPDSMWADYKKNPAPRELSVQLSAKTKTDYTTLTAANVVGRLRGSDEALQDEHVVYTAHLDHVGVGEPVDGDSIYNGAHDNASGVACVLEIARIYAQTKERPRRSILFVMLTAEEMGLLGSEFFTRFPTVPAENMVANVNMDMPTLIAPLLSIEPLGAEHSDLMNNVRAAASRLDLDIMPDHMPEQVRFIRSDQYNFVRRGIPALHVKYGLKSADTLDLASRIKTFIQNVYHKPSDELNDSFDFKAAEIYVRLNFLIGHSVAEQDQRPSWNEGDIFGRGKE